MELPTIVFFIIGLLDRLREIGLLFLGHQLLIFSLIHSHTFAYVFSFLFFCLQFSGIDFKVIICIIQLICQLANCLFIGLGFCLCLFQIFSHCLQVSLCILLLILAISDLSLPFSFIGVELLNILFSFLDFIFIILN